MVCFYYSIKSGKKGSVVVYFVYILWGVWEDLIYIFYGNFLEWVVDSLKLFWRMVNVYECVNGVVYCEYEIVFFNELI